MKWSIIIPSYLINARLVALANKCIASIHKTTKQEYEIIMVESGEYEVEGADILIRLQDQTPFARAVNLGTRVASGEYLVICNNDLELPEGWEEAIEETFESDDNCAIATLQSSEENKPEFDEIREDFFGGFWVIHEESFFDIGDLDEQFVNSFEDADYWLRTRADGAKILKNCKLNVLHHARQTVDIDLLNHSQNYIKNRELFNQKHEGSQDSWFAHLR